MQLAAPSSFKEPFRAPSCCKGQLAAPSSFKEQLAAPSYLEGAGEAGLRRLLQAKEEAGLHRLSRLPRPGRSRLTPAYTGFFGRKKPALAKEEAGLHRLSRLLPVTPALWGRLRASLRFATLRFATLRYRFASLPLRYATLPLRYASLRFASLLREVASDDQRGRLRPPAPPGQWPGERPVIASRRTLEER